MSPNTSSPLSSEQTQGTPLGGALSPSEDNASSLGVGMSALGATTSTSPAAGVILGIFQRNQAE